MTSAPGALSGGLTLTAVGAAAGVSAVAGLDPHGDRHRAWAALLAGGVALAAGTLLALLVTKRLGAAGSPIPAVCALLLLSAAVACPGAPDAEGVTLAAFAVSAAAAVFAGVCAARAAAPRPGHSLTLRHIALVATASAAGWTAAVFWLPQARGGVSVLTCMAGLLLLGRTTTSFPPTS